MIPRNLAIAAIAVTSSFASADVTIRADILTAAEDPADPPGLIVIDIMIDVTEGDAWTASGLRIATLNQARIIYADDPNSAQPLLVNPGAQNRYVTSLSHPALRLGNARFQNSRAIIAGAYCPSGPQLVATPTELNVAYFTIPSPDLIDRDGAVARIVIEHNFFGCLNPGCGVGIFPVDDVPIWAAVHIARCETFSCNDAAGMVAASRDQPVPAGQSWVFAMAPESFPCPYDLNFDCSGQVDLEDLITLLVNFGDELSEWIPADLDRNRRIDIVDLTIFLSHFGDDCCAI